MSKENRLIEIEQQKGLMIEYLNMKIYQQDWHGVADAAMDLRDLEAEVKGLNINE